MVCVECTCIVNLNNTNFCVFSYSTTEKTKKGVWRIFWLRESAVFYFYLFSSLFKRSEL